MRRSATATPHVDVDVVVPTFNNLAELKSCMTALERQSMSPRRVFICVDGSSDGTLEYLKERVQQASLEFVVLTHPGDRHGGLAATRNLPLELLDSTFVWYLDSDMVPDVNALAGHLSLATTTRCTSQGQVVYSNARDSVWAGYLDTRAYHRSADRGELPFKWLSAANLLVSAEHVSRLRGFDADFTSYGGEEFDFAYRLERLADGPLVNNRRAIAFTVEGKTVDRALEQLFEYGSKNLHTLESKHPDMPRMFELQRLGTPALSDRVFAALALNPLVDRLVATSMPIAPRRLRNQLLNYRVVSAVWRGYRSARVTA